MVRHIQLSVVTVGIWGALLIGASDAGAEIAAGRWSGTVLNRFKGHQTVSFDVSEDGRRIENVTFEGYWDCKSSGLTVLENLDPPGAFDVAGNGAFGDTRRDEKAAMWWELDGRFLSDRSAEGNILIAYAGTECTSYRLEWTAQPQR